MASRSHTSARTLPKKVGHFITSLLYLNTSSYQFFPLTSFLNAHPFLRLILYLCPGWLRSLLGLAVLEKVGCTGCGGLFASASDFLSRASSTTRIWFFTVTRSTEWCVKFGGLFSLLRNQTSVVVTFWTFMSTFPYPGFGSITWFT